MDLVSPADGKRTKLECDPERIVELRKNQFDSGIWIRVQGESMDTYLQDVDDETILSVCETLRGMLPKWKLQSES